MIALVISALLVGGQLETQAPRHAECVNVYFVNFRLSSASIVSGETRWEGLLHEYNPSNNISEAFRLCPVGDSITFSTESGVVTVPIPEGSGEVHILIDSLDVAASTAASQPPDLY